MPRTTSRVIVLASFVFVAFIAGCKPVSPPTPDPASLQKTIQAIIAQQAAMTAAAPKTPTSTIQPTEASTPTQAISLTPTPDPAQIDFTDAKIFVAAGGAQISVTVPGAKPSIMQGKFTATVEGIQFKCVPYLSKALYRLICLGQQLPKAKMTTITVFAEGRPDPIYTGNFSLPY